VEAQDQRARKVPEKSRKKTKQKQPKQRGETTAGKGDGLQKKRTKKTGVSWSHRTSTCVGKRVRKNNSVVIKRKVTRTGS